MSQSYPNMLISNNYNCYKFFTIWPCSKAGKQQKKRLVPTNKLPDLLNLTEVIAVASLFVNKSEFFSNGEGIIYLPRIGEFTMKESRTIYVHTHTTTSPSTTSLQLKKDPIMRMNIIPISESEGQGYIEEFKEREPIGMVIYFI